MTKTSIVSHVHLSGRFDRSPSSLHAQINPFVTGEDRVSIATGTETEYEKRKVVLRKVEDYGKFVSSESYSDDSFVLFDLEDWTEIHREAYQVTKIKYINERGIRRDGTYAKILVLEHNATGRRVLVSVCHMPSSIQKGDGFKRNSQRVRAWMDGARNWRKRRNKVYRKFKCSGMMITADWNVDIKSKFFRGVMNVLHPTMSFVWDMRQQLPVLGTLGTRIIDFTLFRGKIAIVRRPVIDKMTGASDHRPFREALRVL